MGFDVWVYTGDYHSEFFLKLLFRLHHVKIDGIVNGKKSSKIRDFLKQEFYRKYKMVLHVDNEALISVNTQTREYEIYDINPEGASWSTEMFENLKKLTIPEA